MALNARDFVWLNQRVQLAVEQTVAPLRQQLADLAAELDETGDAVWALNAISHRLENLIPAESAWAAAQDIQAELESVVSAQRYSKAGQRLALLRTRLLRKAVCR